MAVGLLGAFLSLDAALLPSGLSKGPTYKEALSDRAWYIETVSRFWIPVQSGHELINLFLSYVDSPI